MSTLLFMLGVLVGAVLAIFAYTKTNAIVKNNDRTALDILISVLLILVCIAVLIIAYRIVPGAFIGYVIGIILGVLVCLTTSKNSETK